MRKVGRWAVPVLLGVVALSGRALAEDAPGADDGEEALKTPRRALAAREVELDAAQKELNGVADKLRARFDQSDEWKQAQSDLKKAQADRDAAVTPALEKLRDSAEYKAAADAKAKAAAEVDRLRAAGTTGPEVVAAAKASAHASAAVQKMEAAAIAADPAAKAATAKALECGTKCTDVQKKFNDSIKLSPEFEKATKRVEEATERRDRAAVAVRQMEAREAAKKAARKNARKHK